MFGPKRGVPLFLAILTVAVPSPAADSLASMRAKFFSEAPKGWEELESAAQTIEVTATSQTVARSSKAGSDRVIVRNFLFLRNRQMQLYHLMQKTVNGKRSFDGEVLLGSNGLYRFLLAKKSGSDNFVLRSFGSETSEVDPSTELLDTFLSLPWSIPGYRLSSLVKSASFKLVDIKREQAGKGELVKVEFRTASPQNDARSLRGGWILFEPDAHWAMQQFEVELPSKKVSGQVAYEVDDSGFLRPKRVSYVETYTSASLSTGRYEATCDFQNFEYRVVPESRFTLSAFGLPELDTKAHPRYRQGREYLFFGVGVLLLAVAICVRRVRK